MLANRGELLAKIRLGEDSFLELKEVRLAGGKIRGPAQDDLADELAAFANSAGGVLLLGVEDKAREVVGIPVERLDAVEALLRQTCEDSLCPPLAPLIERLTLPDGDGHEQPVLRVEVARSLFVHQSPGGYLHRVGSSRRSMPPDHLARLFQQRSQSRLIRFDETPVMAATLADLEEPLWRRFAPQQATDKGPALLQKLAMAAQDEQGSWHPTVAGLLMSSRAPQHFLPGAFSQAVAYQGSTVVPAAAGLYQRDAQDIVGPLDRQILSACDFVRKNMRVAARKRPDGGREDRPQFDLLAVFEAVTNAVAHRDYFGAGVPHERRKRTDADDLRRTRRGCRLMAKTTSKPWHQVVQLRDEITNQELSQKQFAADLYDVVMGRNAGVYHDAREFFALTYPTVKLRDLARDVTHRLSGRSEKAVRQLHMTFGGGKTHALITLVHLVRDPATLPDIPAVHELGKQISKTLYDEFKRLADEGIQPVESPDVPEILRRRLLKLESCTDRSQWPSQVFAALNGVQAIDEYTAKNRAAEEKRYTDSYPFHPALIETLYQKWTLLEGFQQTRGILKTLASALRDAVRWDQMPIIGAQVFLVDPKGEGLGLAAREMASIAQLEQYEGRRQNWGAILEAELAHARKAQEALLGVQHREIEQAVMATFLHSQPIGQRAASRELKMLVGVGSPDRIELDKGLARWSDASWYLDDTFTSDREGGLPKVWRLGSKPNLKQMHHDARQNVSATLVDEVLEKEIRAWRAICAPHVARWCRRS